MSLTLGLDLSYIRENSSSLLVNPFFEIELAARMYEIRMVSGAIREINHLRFRLSFNWEVGESISEAKVAELGNKILRLVAVYEKENEIYTDGDTVTEFAAILAAIEADFATKWP